MSSILGDELNPFNGLSLVNQCQTNPSQSVQDGMITSLVHYYSSIDYQRLIEVFQEKVKDNSFSNPDTVFYSLKIAFGKVFATFTPKELAAFSETSKCCYLATKTDSVWQEKLHQLLPSVNGLVLVERCSLELQFKIIFKKMNHILKFHETQLANNKQQLEEFSIAKDKAVVEYEKTGGDITFSKLFSKATKGKKIDLTHPCYQAYTQSGALTKVITQLELQQKSYPQTIEAISKNFNDQITFKKVIQEAMINIPLRTITVT